MRWNVAEAKQKFSEVVRQVTREPQFIYSRNRLVATMVDPETFQAFEAWRTQQQLSLADAFAELRRIAAEEDYELEIPARWDRENTFIDVVKDISR